VRLSILLPTRNGGAALRDCLSSIVRQEGVDFELVVSDNASDDESRDIIEHFASRPEVVYLRQATALPVAENWQAALDASTGDYILLMGDDDVLLPNAARRIASLIQENGTPEVISYNGYVYVGSGALGPGTPAQYSDYAFPRWHGLPPGTLPRALRRELVLDLFRLNIRIYLNLQTTVVARRALNRLSDGSPFKMPYPDFYVVAALLLTADSWVYTYERLVVVGTAPGSFAWSMMQAESPAHDYLGAQSYFAGMLPGNELVNGLVLTLEQLKRDFRAGLVDFEVDRRRYLVHQVATSVRRWRGGGLSRRELAAHLRALSARDWLLLASGLIGRLGELAKFLFTPFERRDLAEYARPGLRPVVHARDIAEFVSWVEERPAAVSPTDLTRPGSAATKRSSA
jgi:glycosyltransferase involved in cell wall biosynthesis